jgi:VCBS repeat-containing protein
VDSFSYGATDGSATVGATLAITITGSNDKPVVSADTAAILATQASVRGNLLSNDSDIDAGTVLSVAAGSVAGKYGTLVLGANGSYVYNIDTAAAAMKALGEGQKLVEHFDFGVSDSLATVASGLDITITGVNDAPVVAADLAAVSEDGIVKASGNVLANDSDVDNGTVLKVAAPGSYAGAYGTLTIAADGSYTYSLDNGAKSVQSLAQGKSVVDSFSYGATDGSATVGSTLAITITGSNDKPVLVADTAAILANQASVRGNVLSNDSDIDAGTVLSVTAGSVAGKYGTLVLGADGSYVYNLDTTAAAVKALGRGATAVEHFDYTGSDGIAALLSSLDITVTGTNDAPVLVKTMADLHINFNKAFWFRLPTGVFADPDKGDTLVFSAKLANGSALPSWLKFDAATGTFSGTAPKDVTSFDVLLTATDKATGTGASLSVSDVFKLYVDHGNNGGGNGVDAAPPGQLTDKDTPPTTDTLWLLQPASTSGVAQSSGGGAHYAAADADMNVSLVGVHGVSGFEFAVS